MKNASGTLFLPKLGRYFKLICARTRRERAKYTVQSTRGSAEVFEPLSNKVIAQIRKKYPRRRLPSGKIPNGIFLQAGLAVFAFRGYARSNKNIAPPFNSRRTPSSGCAP